MTDTSQQTNAIIRDTTRRGRGESSRRRRRHRAEAPFPFTVQRFGNHVLVELQRASIVERGDVEQVGRELEHLARKLDPPRLAVSFAEVEHVSAQFLSRLVALSRALEGRGGQLTLTQVHGRLREVFRLTKLDTQLTIREPARVAQRSVAPWATVAATAVGVSLLGLYLLGRLWLDGAPDTGRRAADGIAWASMTALGSTPLLLPPIFLLRRRWGRFEVRAQWLAAAAFIALMGLVFVSFLMAR